jgi:Tol biopolymer transport system component
MVVGDAEAPAISPDGLSIAFTRRRAGSYPRVFVAPLADTARARVLTSDADGLWEHDTPAWSPDGRTICYAGHADLWTVASSGGRPTRLTTESEADYEPAYSGDGRWVYFTSLRGGTTAIWRVPATGGTPERVTMGSGPERQPSLAADGSTLVYSTYSLNANVVIRVEATGKEYEIGSERDEVSPAFAPDGSAIVYTSEQVKSPPDLWMQSLSADGSPTGPARRLTDHPGVAAHPSFSPDGRWIAYYRVLDGRRSVWIVPSTGGTPSRLIEGSGQDIHPAWSPDGRNIAFTSEHGPDSHVWMAPIAEGKLAGAAVQLTEGQHADVAPAWSPDSSMIAFVAMGSDGSKEAWVVDVGGKHAARAVTRGAQAHRVAWGAGQGTLLVSGQWGSRDLALKTVDLLTGQATSAGRPGLFGPMGGVGEFALTQDGRLLAVVRNVAKGDIWLMRATSGRY